MTRATDNSNPAPRRPYALRGIPRVAPWTLSVAAHILVVAVLCFVYVFRSTGHDKALVVPEVRLTRAASVAPITSAADRPADPRGRFAAAPAPVERPADDVPSPDAEARSIDLLGGDAGSLDLWPADSAARARSDSSRFFSAESEGRNIVYVADWSGSLISGGAYDLVLRELMRSISGLAPSQYFHVILFSTGRPRELDPPRLTPATDRAKLRAWRFIRSVAAAGGTEALPALRRAFAVLAKADPRREGKVVFLLTDGYMDIAALRGELRKLNADGEVSVNIILHQQLKSDEVDLLGRTAEENGGAFVAIGGTPATQTDTHRNP